MVRDLRSDERRAAGRPAAAVLVLLLAWAPAAAAIDASLLVQGSSTGPFPGESTIPGREDSIEVLGYAESFVLPSGGGLQCRPLVVRKLIDRTTPLFASALFTSESLSLSLTLWRPASLGGTEAYFRVQLVNARVSAISRAGGENDLLASEQISVSYTNVVYQHLPSGIEYGFGCSSPG